jgi:hypothetical protein
VTEAPESDAKVVKKELSEAIVKDEEMDDDEDAHGEV